MIGNSYSKLIEIPEKRMLAESFIATLHIK
jgi:hypothetical protein